MNSDINESQNGNKNNQVNSSDKITFKTGNSTYSFTKSWVENDALKDILVGLIVDDYNKQGFNDKK